MLAVTPSISIPDHELEERFIRASGPGGQNVNKTASAVQLRFNVADSPSLPDAVRRRLLSQARNRINSDGELVIEAKRYRSQERNRADARARLARIIARAAETPKRRKPTRPSRAARERRIQNKKKRGQKKGLRKPPSGPDG